MTVELSDEGCPECGHRLQIIYDSERKQVVTGWACPDCGFVASEKEGFQDVVPLSEDEEYILRIEKSLTTADLEESHESLVETFRARAEAEIEGEEVWMLIDPDDGTLVDILAGDSESDTSTTE